MMRKEKTMGDYVPAPVDISDVILPRDLAHLTERLAENVHETWAQGRMREGWIYGECRDDQRKTTPCLVPYEKLPEQEKAYDRETVSATLRLIYKLGYKIVWKEDGEV